MSDVPIDPFSSADQFDDACVAIGVAVLDVFACGASSVIVIPDGNGGWRIEEMEE